MKVRGMMGRREVSDQGSIHAPEYLLLYASSPVHYLGAARHWIADEAAVRLEAHAEKARPVQGWPR